FDVFQVLESLLAQKSECFHGADADFAVNVIQLVRVQFGEPLFQRAERKKRYTVDARDLVFVRLAHVDDFDAELRFFERLLHFVDSHFVGVLRGRLRLGRDAAEHLVIDELGDRRIFATDRALYVATQLELAKLHVERIEQEQTSDQRTPFTQRELQYLRRLNAADDPRQHAQHTAFRATGHHSRWRRFGIKAAIARPADMRGEDAGLTFKTKDGAVNIRLFEQHAGIVGQVARREIVRSINNDVVVLDDLDRVFAREARVMKDDVDPGVDAVDGFLRRLRFGPADVGVGVKDLALEIGVIDGIKINNAEFANAGGCQIHGDGRAEAARPDAEDARGTDLLLAGQTDFRKDQVPRVTANLVVA